MRKTIGIDIGTHSIKVVELERKKAHLELTRNLLIPVSGGDSRASLKALLLEKKLPAKRVNISLSGPSVIVRYIEMPPMKKDELKSAIKFEAEKYIPFNLKDSIIDCQPLEKTASGAERVLLVAAKKNEVNNLIETFKEFGLEVNIIDIDSFAFLNAFQRLKIENKKETYALINIGSRFSNMNILKKGNVYFTRDVLWGGQDITDRIAASMGISPKEAEALKQKPAEKREELINMIMPVLERISSQIRISFDFFESQFGSNVERLYISGGASYLFNMVDYLKDTLGIEIAMWSPLEGIRVDDSIQKQEIEQRPALFAVAVGLALRV